MKSYLRGFISGVVLALSSVMFMGAQFNGFKNINDVYNLVVEIKEDVEYLKKWGVECNDWRCQEFIRDWNPLLLLSRFYFVLIGLLSSSC